MSQRSKGLFWFRRDLRLSDHRALRAALSQCQQVWCVFVFDRDILDRLENRADRRVEFIWESVQELKNQLIAHGSDLIVLYDRAVTAVPALAQQLLVNEVYCGQDYEPAALERDQTVQSSLLKLGIGFQAIKDQVVFEKTELLTGAGKPYTVFTPYKNAWLKRLEQLQAQENPVGEQIIADHEWSHLVSQAPLSKLKQTKLPSLADMGFELTNLSSLKIPTGEKGAQSLLTEFIPRMNLYKQTRDFPAIKGPSYLSVHLRFGTVSVRQLCRQALQKIEQSANDSLGEQTWLAELIWRDFYFQILFNWPHSAQRSFKPAYDAIEWENDPVKFKAWCDGKTGYPLVDAAMLQLNQTGYMHNRLRMVVACFLTKDLGVDWRWGETYFAKHLNDFDLAANNGGWQWASSTGCDAQPYFRIFNPISQSEKFDAKGAFIRRYLPQLTLLDDKTIHAPWACGPIQLQAAKLVLGKDYPFPIVDHNTARQQTLARYAVVKTTDPK